MCTLIWHGAMPDRAGSNAPLLSQAASKKAAPHAKPTGAPIFKGVTWSSSNGQWRAQAWDGKKVGSIQSYPLWDS